MPYGWCVFKGSPEFVSSCTQEDVTKGLTVGGMYKTKAAAEAALRASQGGGGGGGGGGTGHGGGGGGGGGGFDGSSHGPTVAQWLTTPLCRTVAAPAPGDLACWPPNAHMGIVISPTQMISALNPALGTRITSIASAHTGVPVYRRLLAAQATGPVPSGGQPQNIARMLLGRFGWGPSEMPPLVSLWTGESNWNPKARNVNSGALGIAQALGHGSTGTGGTLGNEYGAQYGLSQADAQAANSGSALQQIRWGLGYIKARYGSPAAAYSAWLSRSPHWY